MASMTFGKLAQLADLLEDYQEWARDQSRVASAQGDQDRSGYWSRRVVDAADLRMTLIRSGATPVSENRCVWAAGCTNLVRAGVPFCGQHREEILAAAAACQ